MATALTLKQAIAAVWQKFMGVIGYADISGIGDGTIKGAIAGLNGKIRPVGLLDTGYITNTNVNTYNCAWAPYEYLLVIIGTYSNTHEVKLIPSAVFNATTSTSRLVSYINTDVVEIHKNGSTKVNVKVNDASANLRVRFFGVW